MLHADKSIIPPMPAESAFQGLQAFLQAGEKRGIKINIKIYIYSPLLLAY